MADLYPYDGRNRYGERNPFETLKELQKAFFGDKEEDKKPLEGVVDAVGTNVGGLLETGQWVKSKLPQPVQTKVEETGAVASTALETLDKTPTPLHPMGSNLGEVDQTAMELGIQTANLLNVDPRAGAALFLVFNPLDPLGLITDIPKIPKAIKYASKFEDIKDTAKVGTRYLANRVSSYFSPAQRQVAVAGGGSYSDELLNKSIFSASASDTNKIEDILEVQSVRTANREALVNRNYGDLKSRKQTVERELLLSSKGAPLLDIIESRQVDLAEQISKGEVIKVKDVEIPIMSITDVTEASNLVREYIKQKKALGFKKNLVQYVTDLGAFKGPDGSIYRWSETQDKLVSTKNLKKRQANQALFPTGDDFDAYRVQYGAFKDSLRREQALKLGLPEPEAHHMDRLENQVAQLSQTVNDSGELVQRSEEFINETARILKDKHGLNLGDVNENFLVISMEGHRVGEFSPHVTLPNITDIEKPRLYAEADKIQVVLKSGETKWLDVQHKGKSFVLKDGDKVIPNKLIESKGDYKFGGRTYTKDQRVGFSKELIRTLAEIKDPEKLADAYALFMKDAGAHEVMAGAATLGSFAYDNPNMIDALTRKIRHENIPHMKEYIKMMLNTPQYKNNKNLIALNNRFDELWVRKQGFMRDVERSEELSGTFFRQNLDAN